jgi:hypothetical protein
MLTTSLTTPQTREHYRAGLAGPHRDALTGWREAQRDQSRRILHRRRGAHRFACWAHSTGFTLQALDAQALAAYGHPLPGLQRLRYPRGR